MTTFIKNINEKNHVDAKAQVRGVLVQKMAEKLAAKRVEVAQTFTKKD